ncbi:LacI family DNA-binding transcriptional regulator [Aquamicrobium segne]|uniref:LacI family DNA-binding transcriptional regulator n=1 Tax=Aquamicrobium segne TaxID=469547 RepID=A0ABW0GYT9_9HYPH
MRQRRKQDSRRVTVKDLAKDLGMSVSTVSRAFYPDAVIAEPTRKTVLERAAELGYRPNPFAQSLITKRTQIAGMVVSDLTNPFYPEVMTQMLARLQAVGMNVMLAAANEPDQTDEAVDLLLSYQPDLLIVLAVTLSSHAWEKCEQGGTPCIFFNRLSANGQGFGISCDNEMGGRQVADFLIDTGHRNLLYVSAFPDASTNVERYAGFRARTIERGLAEPEVLEAGLFTYEAGYQAGLNMAHLKGKIDGVFCANDIVAIGFMEGAQAGSGLRVPDDLSVVGFDDITMAGWPSHELTTVPQPLEDMMEAIVGLALELSNSSARPSQKIHCFAPGKMIIRNSTRSRVQTSKDLSYA